MVLYTPYDVEVIMQDLSREDQNLKEVSIGNGITLLGRDGPSGFQIERVISGNTNVYLLPEYQPGTVIKIN